jgi:DNA-binding response OmpR family regulator
MQAPNAVIAINDPDVAKDLSASLQGHFNFIYRAPSLAEVRAAMLKYRPEVLILDVELAPLSTIQRLRREYKGVTVVCTHRLADEDMWVNALNAGANDVCRLTDVAGLVRAATGQTRTRAVAA